MMRRLTLLSLAAAATVVPTGCIGLDLDAPSPPGPPAPALSERGYRLHSVFDVSAGELYADPNVHPSRVVNDLVGDPGATLLRVLEQAGEPLLADLEADLSEPLAGQFEGWFSAAMNEHTDVGQILALSDRIDRFTMYLEIDSSLELGSATPIHRLSSLRLGADGEDAGVELPFALRPEVILESPVDLSFDSWDVFIRVPEIALPLGAYAWEALQVNLRGDTTRALLGDAVDCAAAATEVAARSVDGVTFGHEAALVMLCERGLDRVDATAMDRVRALDITLILDNGRAGLRDFDVDHVTDSFDGHWGADVDAGGGRRLLSGTLEGELR